MFIALLRVTEIPLGTGKDKICVYETLALVGRVLVIKEEVLTYLTVNNEQVCIRSTDPRACQIDVADACKFFDLIGSYAREGKLLDIYEKEDKSERNVQGI